MKEIGPVGRLRSKSIYQIKRDNKEETRLEECGRGKDMCRCNERACLGRYISSDDTDSTPTQYKCT